MLTLAEAIAIVAWLGEQNRLDVIQRKWQEICADANALTDPHMDRAKWFRLQKRCVFLTADNLCSVYPVRPGACRTHVSLDDPDHCKPGYEGKIASMDTSAPAEVVAWASADIVQNLNLPMAFAPLQVAVAWATEAWAKGLDSLRRSLQKYPALKDETNGMSAWMHLLRDDPAIRDKIKITEMADGTTRVEINIKSSDATGEQT